jgi:hypothetical protein
VVRSFEARILRLDVWGGSNDAFNGFKRAARKAKRRRVTAANARLFNAAGDASTRWIQDFRPLHLVAKPSRVHSTIGLRVASHDMHSSVIGRSLDLLASSCHSWH